MTLTDNRWRPAIEDRSLGRTGLQVSCIAFGTDNFLDAQTRAACDAPVPPGTAVADFHNTSGWMKMSVGPNSPKQ